jgi:hypothetical protein
MSSNILVNSSSESSLVNIDDFFNVLIQLDIWKYIIAIIAFIWCVKRFINRNVTKKGHKMTGG